MRRSGRIGHRTFLAAAAAAAVLLPAAAGAFNPLGDGSATDNPDLQGEGSCENCTYAAPPQEWNDPLLDVDWSLSLRGAYVQGAEGARFEALAVPAVSLRHETLRGSYSLDAEAELAKGIGDAFRVQSLRLGLGGERVLDEVTGLSGNLELQLTQNDPGSPGQPDDVAVAPLEITGTAALAAERRFGRFVASLRAGAGRAVYGATTLADGSREDNSDQDNWTLDGGLRLGYAVTPLLTAFIDGEIGYQRYDEVSPDYGVALDAADYEVRAGLAADWHQIIEAEASVGLGLRRFAEPALGEVTTTLYDASLTFRPDETVTLRAELATSVGAPGPDAGGTARVEYAATGSASYQVNPWLRLRASAGWERAELVGSDGTESGYSFGGGLDYRLSEHATVTADYDFAHAASDGGPGEDEQRLTLGVTLAR